MDWSQLNKAVIEEFRSNNGAVHICKRLLMQYARRKTVVLPPPVSKRTKFSGRSRLDNTHIGY